MLLELALLGLLACFWGSSYLFIKVALGSIPPVTLIAFRVVVAAVLLLGVLRLRGLRLPRERRMWGALSVQGLLSCVVPWLLLAWGQQYVDSGLAGVLNSTSPMFVFLISLTLTHHEVLNWQRVLGLLLGVLGVCFIVGVEALGGLGQQVTAQLATLLSAGVYATAAIYGRRFRGVPPAVVATGVLLCAGSLLLPLSLLLEQPWNLRPTLPALLAALGLAVLSTAGALLLYFRLIQTLGPLGAASQSYLRSGISVLLGVLLLGEPFTWNLGLGLLCAILGVIAINGQLEWLAGRSKAA